jgi:hypothetical protein
VAVVTSKNVALFCVMPKFKLSTSVYCYEHKISLAHIYRPRSEEDLNNSKRRKEQSARQASSYELREIKGPQKRIRYI